MSKLFDIVKNEVRLNPDIIAIPALNTLWERDTSRNKINAKKELSYIVFLADFKSPYRDLFYKDRTTVVKDDVFGKRSSWVPDESVLAAIEKYKQLQKTPTMYLLESAEEAVDKLASYFRTINFDEVDDVGKAAKDLAASVIAVGNIRKSLTSLKQQVESEISDNNSRGGNEIYYYENPESVQNLKLK
jgi:hypothetical protein